MLDDGLYERGDDSGQLRRSMAEGKLGMRCFACMGTFVAPVRDVLGGVKGISTVFGGVSGLVYHIDPCSRYHIARRK